MVGNPVGELQELTQKRLWPPPIYDFTSEQGPPHAREFICTVRLWKFTEQGTRNTYKVIHKIKLDITGKIFAKKYNTVYHEVARLIMLSGKNKLNFGL